MHSHSTFIPSLCSTTWRPPRKSVTVMFLALTRHPPPSCDSNDLHIGQQCCHCTATPIFEDADVLAVVQFRSYLISLPSCGLEEFMQAPEMGGGDGSARQMERGIATSTPLHLAPFSSHSRPTTTLLGARHTISNLTTTRSKRYTCHWPEIAIHDLQNCKACLHGAADLSELHPTPTAALRPNFCLSAAKKEPRVSSLVFTCSFSQHAYAAEFSSYSPWAQQPWQKGTLYMLSNVVPVTPALYAKWFTLVMSPSRAALCLLHWYRVPKVMFRGESRRVAKACRRRSDSMFRCSPIANAISDVDMKSGSVVCPSPTHATQLLGLSYNFTSLHFTQPGSCIKCIYVC